jgi:hypothetical protein
LPGQMNTAPVVIQYPEHGIDFTPLQIRQTDGSDSFRPFTHGATMTRKMGELISPQIFRVVANPALDGIDIHTYPSAVTESGAQGMSVLPPNQEYYALTVITRASDYLQNGDPVPSEINGHPWGSRPVESFGVGAYLGTLETIDGKPTFHRGRFIQDLRALVAAPVK